MAGRKGSIRVMGTKSGKGSKMVGGSKAPKIPKSGK